MADTQLDIIVKLVDEASEKLKEIKSGVKDVGNASDDTNKKTESNFNSFIKSAAIAAAGMYALKKAFDFASAGVDAYIDASKKMANVNTILQNMGTSVAELEPLLSQLSDTALGLGFDNEAAELSFAKLYQILGDIAQASEAVSVAMDLARAKNIDLETATKSITLALDGSGAVLNQYDIALKDGATAMDVLAAVHDKTANSAKNFAATTAGAMEITKVASGEVDEAVGQKLAGSFLKVEQAMTALKNNEAFLDFVEGVATLIAMLIEGFGLFVTTLGEQWDAVKILTSSALDFLDTSLTLFIDTLYEIFTAWIDAISSTWELITTTFESSLIFISDLWTNTWQAISDFFSTIIAKVQSVFTLGMAFINSLWNTTLNTVYSVGIGIFDLISGAASNFWDTLNSFFEIGTDAVSSVWSNAWDGIYNTVTGVWESIKDTIASGINWVIEKVNALINQINSVTDRVGLPTIPTLSPISFAKGGVVKSYANGGLVYAAQGFQPKGTDTVPAMLTPGEMVLTRDQQKALGGMGSIVVNINNPVVMSEDDIVEKIGDPILKVFKQHFAVV